MKAVMVIGHLSVVIGQWQRKTNDNEQLTTNNYLSSKLDA